MRTLRPYQQAAVDAAMQQLRQSRSSVIVLPTGCGKTVVAAKIISQWEGSVLFLAHTKELIHQAADRLADELGTRPAIEMGVIGQDHDTLYGGAMCVVGSVQSMYSDRRLTKYSNHPFSLIVVDECHHSTASTYRKVIDHFRKIMPECRVLGITATPNRSDGTALGLIFESVAYQMSIDDAIGDGWLVPVKQEYVVVDSINYDDLDTAKNKFGERDFKESQLEEMLVQEETLHKMAVPTIERVGDRSTLFFTSTVRHAHELASVLNRYKTGSAAAVDGTTTREERQRMIRSFSDGSLQFLCNCAVLIEGFDAPQCSAIAMGRPTKSVTSYTQMLGRGLRPLPGIVDGVPENFDRRMSILTSQKPDVLVLDFVGNSQHKIASAYDVLGGNYDCETRELAERESRDGRNDVAETMEQASALVKLEREWKERDAIRARASYASYSVDPFGGSGPAVQNGKPARGGATDAQVSLLVNLGVQRDTALRYSKRQAGAVIDELGRTRCTVKQARVLQKYKINPDGIGFQRAGRIIDAIAANGWQRPEDLPE